MKSEQCADITNFISRTYDGSDVTFTQDGFFNATEFATRKGKKSIEWLRLASTQEYIEAVIAYHGRGEAVKVGKSHFDLASGETSPVETGALTVDDLVITVQGGASPGTWLHPLLAVAFARWLDIRFGVWCDDQIRLLLTGKTEEALANVAALKQQMALKDSEHKAQLKALQSEHDEDLEIAAHKINMPSRYWLKDVIKAQKQADLAEGAKRYAEVTAEVQAEVLAVLKPMLPDLPRRERRDLEAALEWMDKTLRDFKRGRFVSTSY